MNVRFEVADKTGQVLERIETQRIAEAAPSLDAPKFFFSAEDSSASADSETAAGLTQAKAEEAGYLPMEALASGKEIQIFNYKAIARTGLAVMLQSPQAAQMVEAITGSDLRRTADAQASLGLIRAPHQISGSSLQSYRDRRLFVRELARVGQALYAAYLSLLASATSA